MTSTFSTTEKTTTVDWSAGPDDATHYLPDSEDNHELFMKVTEDSVYYLYATNIVDGNVRWEESDPSVREEVLAEPDLIAKVV